MVKRQFLHYLVLVGAIALGTILRFWHLDLKPLWLDEVITALFSLGRNYNDVPLEAVFSPQRLEQIFTFNSDVSCRQIAHNLATQSTHPPLFFCLMHKWLEIHRGGVLGHGLIWSLRSLPALFGVCAIAAVYYLNRIAFSPAAGLMGAAMIAVSPFAVYLSQEARHYTLPMLLITLVLLGLIQIQQDFQRQKLRFNVWLGWVTINIIGCYVHYFFILAFIAQGVTLFGLMYWQRHILPRKSWLVAILAIISVIASFLPWLAILLGHFNRSETNWLPQPQSITPLYQTLVNWVLMIIGLPVENQPLWVAVISGILMVLFVFWVAWHSFRGLKQLWHKPEHRLSILTLASFTLCVLLEFFAVVYLLGKDITIVPRYNFIYYPSLVALIAASLVKVNSSQVFFKQKIKLNIGKQSFYLLFFTGSLLSCVLVVSNFVFQKPYNPQLVAQNMNQELAVPIMVVVGYEDYQDVALGLSFALALKKIRSNNSTEFAFFKRSQGYEYIWEKLSQLPPLKISQLNLWVVAPELKRRDYPASLKSSQTNCTLDPKQYYRIGIPYQLYWCRR
jgi:uncharacterized membrane protein